MAINDSAWIMMAAKDRFRDFIADDICDTSKSREVLTCISADSRDGVDALVDAAIAAGGSKWMDPQDHGFMYGRSFRDLDNHVWEVMWMDPAAARSVMPTTAGVVRVAVAARTSRTGRRRRNT